MQPDVARKDGENWSDFETRHSAKIRDITKALKETGTGTAVPQEIYGWFLVPWSINFFGWNRLTWRR